MNSFTFDNLTIQLARKAIHQITMLSAVALLALAAPCAFAVEEQRDLTFTSSKYSYSAPPKITLFAKDGTPPLSLPVGECDYHCLDSNRFNDKIVAVEIPEGLAVTMCANPGFETHCQTFKSSTKYISVGDGVSSLKVFTYEEPCGWNEHYKKCRTKYSASQCFNHYRVQCLAGPPRYHRNLRAVENTRSLAEDHGECMAGAYNMYLVMQGAHMTGLATPVETDNSCPNLVFHSNIASEGEMTKSVLTIEEEGVVSISDDEKLHLGTQSLASIVSAFESADVSTKGEKAYDAVTNNCVVLLRNMADPLDIQVDKRMITFVSKRLLAESGEHFVDMMKKSPSLSAIVGTGGRFLKGVGAEEIVAKVIEYYV